MRRGFLLPWVLLILLGPAAHAGSEPLAIPGTGACETVLKGLAAAFEAANPGIAVSVPPSVHSEGGIRQVESGEATLARVARTLTPEETARGLKSRVFAKDAVVFAVGSEVKIRGLDAPRLAEIFEGRIDSWEAVQGGKGPIRLLVREPTDAGLRVIRSNVREFRELKFPAKSKILYHDAEMVEMLEKYRNAIGWATRSSLNAASASVRPLALDGVEPAAENVASGKYPLVVDYAVVYLEGTLTPSARKFLDFLFSDAGRGILLAHGLAPPGR